MEQFSFLLDQPFVDAFKSAVTNFWIPLIDFIHHVILYIILFYYLFILYYYLLLLLLFFCFAHSQWWEKIEKRSTDWTNPVRYFPHSKMSFWSVRVSDINWVVLFHLPETVTLDQILVIILQKAQ